MPLTTVNPALLDTQAQYTGFKNRIINPGMVIDQRNAGASVTPTGGTYTLDRWSLAITQASKLTIQQSTTAPAGFKNSLLTTVASAVSSPSASDQFLHRQYIEGFNVSDFGWGTASAQPITVSFWVRSSVTGTFPVAVLNGSFNRSYVATYTVNSANTFEYKTVSIAGDTTGTWATDNSAGINLSFALGVGSNRTTSSANTWQGAEYISTNTCTNLLATSGATFYITGLQLEKGSTATSFDYRDYGRELIMCQRYFQAIKPTLAISADGVVNTILLWPVSYPVQMRATPTVSQSGVFGYELPFGNRSTQSSPNITFDAPTTNNVGAVATLGNFSSLVFNRTYRPDQNTNAVLLSSEL